MAGLESCLSGVPALPAGDAEPAATEAAVNTYDGRPLATVTVKNHGHGVFSFTWQGAAEATLPIAHQIEEREPRLLQLMPWPLVKVGDDLRRGIGLYRRVG